MDQDQAASNTPGSPGDLLREHLFDGDVLQLPAPEEGIPGFLPDWFTGPLPVLVYPPLRAQGVEDGDNVNLEVTPFHIYYGALRELAETADEARSAVLRQLLLQWNTRAPAEVAGLARRHIERALLHAELAQDLGHDDPALATAADLAQQALEHLPEEAGAALGEPSDAQRAFQEAQQVLNSNPARAVELARPLAAAHPEAGEVWFILGAACRRTGDLAEAERCLRRAARLAPAEPFIWWELCRTLLAQDQPRPAEEAIRKALEVDPENPLYLADLGRALLGRGDREGAAEALGRAKDLAPDDPEVAEAAALLS